jgi:hypothetical protein
MGSRNKHYRTRNKNDYRRKLGNRGGLRDRILIVCEGEKTEPNYFKSFKVSSSKVVEVRGGGRDPKRVVKEALRLKSLALKNREPYNQVWCVFDKNSFSAKDFNGAIDFAGQNDLNVAYSNEAFELWYLLHFHFFNTGISRKQYIEKLSKLQGFAYRKNSKTMYDALTDTQQQDAIKHAKKLLSQYPVPDPARNNPSTTVHLLVEELNKWRP